MQCYCANSEVISFLLKAPCRRYSFPPEVTPQMVQRYFLWSIFFQEKNKLLLLITFGPQKPRIDFYEL